MAATTTDDEIFKATDEASIALLRALRTKATVDRSFIHFADVCSAVPEELVAGLQPVPGTDVAEDGYNSVWYIYCPKRYKNARGKPDGHRQRAVGPDGKTCWHLEKGPRPVEGVPGGGGATFCNFSYGRKEKGQPFDRMGWCMTEFDDDTQGGVGGDHVLCRVRRSSSSLAKRKFKSSSSSTKRKAAGDHAEAPPTKLIHDKRVQMQQQEPRQADPRREADGGDHPKAPPAKSIQQQEQVQQQDTQPQGVESEHGGDFNFSIEDMNFYFDESMLRDEPEQGLQQPETAVQRQSEHDEFTVEWFLQSEQPQQPIVEPWHGGEFIQMPFGQVMPVVPEATVDDMLGPETMYGYGQWSGGMTTANTPTTMYTGCCGLRQGSDPLQLPYLTC